MIYTKIFFLTFLSFAFISLLTIKLNKGIRIVEKITFSIIFTFGLFLIINPKVLRYFADLVNIGRGIDLLFYSYTISSLWFLLRTHVRINLIESNLKKVISRQAIENIQD